MSSSITLAFFGGINEIGGNKILLADRNSGVKIFLDFGKSFELSRKFYEFPFTYPETISELISIGAVPPDNSLYTRLTRKDFKAKEIDKSLEVEPSVNAVFISHAHLDHYGYISLLNRKIPIFLGECTRNIVNAASKLIYQQRSPEQFYDGLRLNAFRTNEKIVITGSSGEIVVEPVHVDHSIPGAYGFIVHTSTCSIAYTGDFRKHGPQKFLTEDFIKKLESEDIKVLITEGTHAQYSEKSSEMEVAEKVRDVVEDTKNLIIADFSRSDLDRFVTFYHVARRTKRRLVIDAKRYRIISAILETPGILASDIDLNSDIIALLDEEKKHLTSGEKEVLEIVSEEKRVKLDEIRKNPEKFIFTVVFGGARDIKKLKPPAGSIYLLSSSEPVHEEREISFEKLLNWLEHFGVAVYHIHASGHATPLDIKELIERADPEIVIPIHTERPITLRNFVNKGKWIIPKGYGSKIEI